MKDSDSYYGDNSIVCISDLFWDEHWSSEQQLMSRFSEIWPVLYVERPVSVLSFFTSISDASVGRQFLRWLKGGTRTEGKNLHVLTPPPFLPFRYNPFINKINQRIRIASIKRAMKRIGIERPILWIYEPDAAESIGNLDDKLSIYHCADDWTASRQWWNSVKHVIAYEQSLINKATIVFAISRKLFEDKQKTAREIYYVPNGVSSVDFSNATEVPQDISKITKPLIGCVALFNDRYDYRLIEKSAQRHPSWSFVFVGDLLAKGVDIDRLRSLPNVHFLGNKPRALLGSYIQNFDVCLIPYKPSQFNSAAFPLKLMEYFFFGKPVVSLRLSSIEEFNELVYQYDDEKGFEGSITMAIEEHDLKRREQRFLVAQANTWEKRLNEIISILARHLFSTL
jgi:glycosyltransferase involved in cell wall biosynthesis